MHHKLRERMGELGWTPERLAAEMQSRGQTVGYSTVRAWMAGKRSPNFRNACVIADLMGWSREEMFEAAGYSEVKPS